jgi:hypothetical protein
MIPSRRESPDKVSTSTTSDPQSRRVFSRRVPENPHVRYFGSDYCGYDMLTRGAIGRRDDSRSPLTGHAELTFPNQRFAVETASQEQCPLAVGYATAENPVARPF